MDFLGDPDPTSIERVANELTRAHGNLARTQGDIGSGVSRLVSGSWQGSAAAAFQNHWTKEDSSVTALADAARRMASTLNDLSSALRRAQAIAQHAEGMASAN